LHPPKKGQIEKAVYPVANRMNERLEARLTELQKKLGRGGKQQNQGGKANWGPGRKEKWKQKLTIQEHSFTHWAGALGGGNWKKN